MKRDEHKKELRARVLKTAERLFVVQGYTQTTIKQITREARITTGSLYHFFANKEDILLQLTREVFSMAADNADRVLRDDEDPCLRFSLEIAVQLHLVLKHAKLAELYLAAYQSSRISKHIVQMGARRNSEIFRAYNPRFTDDDYYARTLAVKGILHGFVDELVNYKRLGDRKRIDSILEMILLIFNVPETQIRKAIKKSRMIIQSNSEKIKKVMPK